MTIMATKFTNDGKPRTPNYGDGTRGGPYDRDHGQNRKFNKTSYTGAYTADLNGKPPFLGKQGYRAELPPAAKTTNNSKSGDPLMDGAMEGREADMNVIFRKHR